MIGCTDLACYMLQQIASVISSSPSIVTQMRVGAEPEWAPQLSAIFMVVKLELHCLGNSFLGHICGNCAFGIHTCSSQAIAFQCMHIHVHTAWIHIFVHKASQRIAMALLDSTLHPADMRWLSLGDIH